MAIIKAVSSRAGIRRALDYVMKKEKTERTLLDGFNCNPDTVMEEMEMTKHIFHKTGGRTYKHFVQSFAPDEEITPEIANQVARELVEKLPIARGFEVLIATHKDRRHIHSHLILNSVSFIDGHKFQMSADDLQTMKDISDEICKSHGLSICEKGRTFHEEPVEETSAYTKEKYRLLKSAEAGKVKSYVQETALAVMDAMEEAESREEFIDLMEMKGYRVDWQENHKYITFTDPEGMKVRNKNLEKTYHLDVGKEKLLYVFEENSRRKEREQAAVNAARRQLELLDERDADCSDRKTAQAYRRPGNTNESFEERLPGTDCGERRSEKKSVGRSR